VAGDLFYPDGSAADFVNCYGPTWGRLGARTRPAPGNHEYHQDGASAYARYFGDQTGDPTRAYYSYDLGQWHIVALNSECEAAGGCTENSPQGQWLKQDLAQHPNGCPLACWHKPQFSSGANTGNDPGMRPFWQILYTAGADVVVNGHDHDHDYARFAPQAPDGIADPVHGIREFVVGTGGKNSHRIFSTPKPNSETWNVAAFGVLKLTLRREFIPEAGHNYSDSGSDVCH